VEIVTKNIDQPSVLSFSNTEDAFAYKSKRELKKARFLFSIMGNRLVLLVGLKLIPLFIKWRIPFVETIVKNTIFSQFVGGETLEATAPLVEKFSQYSVDTVIDYGVEGKDENAVALDAVAEEFIKVIRYAATTTHVRFMSIKATGFIRHKLMELMDSLMGRGEGDLVSRYNKAIQQLDDADKIEWELSAHRFINICKAGYEKGIGVWVDAEETWLQDPVDALTLLMMGKYNREKAIVYNTIQLYRHDRLEFLKESHQWSVANNFLLAVKLVRGAYMEKERQLANANGIPSPIQPDKLSCDNHYNSAVAYCINNIENISVVVATHNENSTLKAATLMNTMGLSPSDSRIHFAQLMGMSDNITFNLAHRGYNAQKLVPFGPINDVIPYLMRRAQENSSVKGQTGRELSLISKELMRRKASKA